MRIEIILFLLITISVDIEGKLDIHFIFNHNLNFIKFS